MGPATEKERQTQFQKLVDLLLSVKPENFSRFDVSRTHYESEGVTIGVDILVPKAPKPKASVPRPVMVRIHGGFLVSLKFALLPLSLGYAWWVAGRRYQV
jgi:hypothetical protein